MTVRFVATSIDFARVIGPSAFQVNDILARDLLQPRETRSACIASVEAPLLAARHRKGGKKRAQSRDDHCGQENSWAREQSSWLRDCQAASPRPNARWHAAPTP